jgi:hypothetical protein
MPLQQTIVASTASATPIEQPQWTPRAGATGREAFAVAAREGEPDASLIGSIGGGKRRAEESSS